MIKNLPSQAEPLIIAPEASKCLGINSIHRTIFLETTKVQDRELKIAHKQLYYVHGLEDSSLT